MEAFIFSNNSLESLQGLPTRTTALPGVNKDGRGAGNDPNLRLDWPFLFLKLLTETFYPFKIRIESI